MDPHIVRTAAVAAEHRDRDLIYHINSLLFQAVEAAAGACWVDFCQAALIVSLSSIIGRRTDCAPLAPRAGSAGPPGLLSDYGSARFDHGTD